MARALVALGLAIAGVGVLMWLGLPLGRLPGDFVVRRGNTTFYFPLTTSILASVVLTLIFALMRR